MKLEYTEIEIEIIEFDAEDIITTSNVEWPGGSSLDPVNPTNPNP